MTCTGAHSIAHVQCFCKCGLQQGVPNFLSPRSHCSSFGSLSVVTEHSCLAVYPWSQRTQPFDSLSVVTENTAVWAVYPWSQRTHSRSAVYSWSQRTQPFGSSSVVTEHTAVWQFIRDHREHTAVRQFIRGHREHSRLAVYPWSQRTHSRLLAKCYASVANFVQLIFFQWKEQHATCCVCPKLSEMFCFRNNAGLFGSVQQLCLPTSSPSIQCTWFTGRKFLCAQ